MQTTLGTDSAAASQNLTTITTPSANSTAHQKPVLRQKQNPKRQLSDFGDGYARPKKLAKNSTTGPSSAMPHQQTILDLIERCDGAIPDNSLQLRGLLATPLNTSGERSVPDKRTVDAILKALCAAGKIKKFTFSFKDHRGFMVISSILAKPGVGAADPVVRNLQKKIAEVYPNPYNPPGMRLNRTSQVEDSCEPQLGIQSPHWKQDFDRTGGVMPTYSGLQTIENEESVPGESLEGEPGTKAITRLDHLSDTGWLRGRRAPSNASEQKSSSTSLSTDVGQGVNFLIPQKRPIIFDVRVPSCLQEYGTKPAEKGNNKVAGVRESKLHAMPSSLEEILRDSNYRKGGEHHSTTRLDPGLSQFESEIDSVARWEERSFSRFQGKKDLQNWNFICHSVGPDFESVPMENLSIQFDGLTWYDESGQESIVTPTELKQLWQAVFDTQNSLAGTANSPLVSQDLDASATDRLQSVEAADSSFEVNNPRSPPEKRKRKPAKTNSVKRKTAKGKSRKNRKTEFEPAYITNPDGTVIDVSGYINAPVKRSRGTQHLRNMSEWAVYKLTVAIVVIRTLSGGLDKHIDWTIVMQIFPDEDPDFVRDRWRTIRNKFRRDIAALTENLQERFCSAYVEGEVPDLDFDDIYSNDWEGIVEWALRSLDKSHVNGIEDLPDTREELAETKNMAFEEHRGMREYLGYNVGSSLPVREAAQASIVFAKPVESFTLQPPVFSPDAPEEDEQLRIAKSWALATVLTPEGKFNAHACKKKLSKLSKTSRASDALFDQALKSLVGEKMVVRHREATTGIISRGYDASKLFYDTFDAKRTVQATILRQAAHYKRNILDPLFEAGQQVVFQPTSVADGDMVAILNLLAHGRVRLHIGPDVPKNRYGLLTADGTGTYQTRHLEKDKLSFTVLLEAVEGNYLYGNPTEMQVAPVPAIGDYDKTAIPLWVDIHGNFQDELWDLVICAVVGLISTRPGIDAKELTKTLSPSLKLWETEIVLQWMKRCGFIEVSGGTKGQGWDTKEWWWLICSGTNGWVVGNLE